MIGAGVINDYQNQSIPRQGEASFNERFSKIKRRFAAQNNAAQDANSIILGAESRGSKEEKEK